MLPGPSSWARCSMIHQDVSRIAILAIERLAPEPRYRETGALSMPTALNIGFCQTVVDSWHIAHRRYHPRRRFVTRPKPRPDCWPNGSRGFACGRSLSLFHTLRRGSVVDDLLRSSPSLPARAAMFVPVMRAAFPREVEREGHEVGRNHQPQCRVY